MFDEPATKGQRTAAWAVHAYTALGAAIGFLALRAAFFGQDQAVFVLLSIAFAIDCTDGALARKARVKEVVPTMDGALLDNIIDYLTYVVVPVAIFARPGTLPDGLEWTALSVLLASAYGFSRTDAKGETEHYFRGFPSYWNVMAFYMVMLDTEPMTNLVVLLFFVVMVFVPMRWLYPSRMANWRAFFVTTGIVWALMGIVMLTQMPDVNPVLAWSSLYYPALYTGGSVLYHFRG